MTVARASQVLVEVLRQNTAVNARASQAMVEVVRKEVAPPDIRVSQVVVEVINSLSSDVNAQVDQVVAEVIRAERTLSASFPVELTLDADLVPGISFGATLAVSLTTEGAIELGTELAAVDLPVSVTMDAALMAEPVLSCDMGVTLTQDAGLEKGIELVMNSSGTISVTQRAALRVHPPESSSGFFLLF